jgi:hypothetical protein
MTFQVFDNDFPSYTSVRCLVLLLEQRVAANRMLYRYRKNVTNNEYPVPFENNM